MNKQLILFLVIFSNLEGDYINKNKNDCKYICNRCFLATYIDLKKIFKPVVIRDIFNGIMLLQKENQGD